MLNIFTNKKIIWIAILLVVVVIVGGVSLNLYFNSKKAPDISKIEYRTDVEPLIKRFGKTINIESCFWKADAIGKTNFGPSSYWMKGFIIINKASLSEFQEQYDLQPTNISFEKGIEPNITGFNEFCWFYNKELSKKIIATEYMGEFYLDTRNGIFYFDLVTY